jgi:lysine 2,3-aminomutase
MSRTLREPDALIAAGLAGPEEREGLAAVARRYATAITPAMADLIRRGDAHDPIARQFVPDRRELSISAEERADPIADNAHSPVKGVVHRYADRVLLKPHHACPVYCRFCFRREMVGPGGEALSPAELDAAIAYIADRPEVAEVILTGGDPMMMAPRRLADLIGRLAAIEHVAVVRLHTRVPVVDGARVDAAMLAALRAPGAAVWVGLHVNHARELEAAGAEAAIGRLADGGVPLVSQTVLLAGINDETEILADLFRRLIALRVKPYYLHVTDPAPGTAHLRVSQERGQAIMRALRGRLSGLAQPTLVLDPPDGSGKIPVGPVFAPGQGGAGRREDDQDACRGHG